MNSPGNVAWLVIGAWMLVAVVTACGWVLERRLRVIAERRVKRMHIDLARAVSLGRPDRGGRAPGSGRDGHCPDGPSAALASTAGGA